MTSWTEKLNAPARATRQTGADFDRRDARGRMMLVPTAPGRRIHARHSAGRAWTCALRKALAKQHGAEVTCPVYTGYPFAHRRRGRA